MMKPVEIRNARAAEATFLAEVLLMAGRGHLARGPWDLIFPDGRERRRALEHLAGGGVSSWCHHSLFQVADRDGEACAALVAFAPEELGDVSLGKPMLDVFQLLAWTPERMRAVAPMVAPYQRCFPEMPPESWIIENVGTRADRRRQGLVHTLLERALETGRSRGYRRAQISCLIGNLPAQRAYEKAGFVGGGGARRRRVRAAARSARLLSHDAGALKAPSNGGSRCLLAWQPAPEPGGPGRGARTL